MSNKDQQYVRIGPLADGKRAVTFKARGKTEMMTECSSGHEMRAAVLAEIPGFDFEADGAIAWKGNEGVWP